MQRFLKALATTVFVIAICVFALENLYGIGPRNWKNNKGKSLHAKFVDIIVKEKDGKETEIVVLIRTKDKKQFEIPITVLSELDQKVARRLSDRKDKNEGTQPQSKYRKWRSKDGKFSLTARLVKTDENSVTLQSQSDSQFVTVPIEDLSQADQAYIVESSLAQSADNSRQAGGGSLAIQIDGPIMLFNGKELPINARPSDVIEILGPPRYHPPLGMSGKERFQRQLELNRASGTKGALKMAFKSSKPYLSQYLIWDSLGVYAITRSPKNDGMAYPIKYLHVMFQHFEKNAAMSSFFPRERFSGTLKMNGNLITVTSPQEEIRKAVDHKDKLVDHDRSASYFDPPFATTQFFSKSADPFKKSWDKFSIAFKATSRDAPKYHSQNRQAVDETLKKKEQSRKQEIQGIAADARAGKMTVPQLAPYLKGRSKSQVIELLGNPDSVYDSGDGLVFRERATSELTGKAGSLWINFTPQGIAHDVRLEGEKQYFLWKF